MKVLGLDLGVASIGWALIEIDETFSPQAILGMGSRIVNLRQNEDTDFIKGSGISTNSERTSKRTIRKGYDRFKMRRDYLSLLLNRIGLNGDEECLKNLPPLDVWHLRSRAATEGEQLTPAELGRVLLHLNQKRGYRHARQSSDSESKDTEYVADINKRYEELKASGKTLGQKYYEELKDSSVVTPNGRTVVTGRIKEGDPYSSSHLLSRQAHIEEFNKIMEGQSRFYPDILNQKNINLLRQAIFFQRPLKSCKNLVSDCEFISHVGSDGKTYRPKVAPKSSPLAEITRIWEAVNNIILSNRLNKPRKVKKSEGLFPAEELGEHSRDFRLLQREYVPDMEERRRLFDYLMENEKMSVTALLKELGLKRADGFSPNLDSTRGLKGNVTRCKIKEALEGYSKYDRLLRFDLKEEDRVDPETGEVRKIISKDYINEPFYRLWHVLYSIPEKADLERALKKQFGITETDVIERLYNLDLKSGGFTNRSAQFMRQILPYLQAGEQYSKACESAGYNHSGSLTLEENAKRELLDKLPLLRKNSLRQPTVEKVLNQMINLVNAIIDEFGPIDEVRIELARELKKSKDERAKATSDITANAKRNEEYGILIAQHGIKPSRNRLSKYRMWEESDCRCVYCGIEINIVSFLGGEDSEVDHIVPRALLFDDSFSNKVCSCRKCNQEKGRRTAYDFMSSLGEDRLQEYLVRVQGMFDNKDRRKRISKTKYKRLLMPETEIPVDFIERDLRETQYISRKAMSILREVSRNVYASSGSVTDFFRHIWGYDDILHDLNLPRYEKGELVKDEEYEHKGQIHKRRRIEEWTKRLDHRHHAIDALTVALTRQGYVQRLNNLSKERGFMRDDIENQGVKFKENDHLLSQWGKSRPHFPVRDVAERLDEMVISFKAGKKVSTLGKIHRRSDGSVFRPLVPRSPLHEESVYGKMLFPVGYKNIKYCLANIQLVEDEEVRRYLQETLDNHSGDSKKALKWLKKNPLKNYKTGEERTEFKCFEERMVYRYKLATLKANQIEKIVDNAVRDLVRARFDSCKNEKEFQQSLITDPLRFNSFSAPIKHVRCFAHVAPESTVVIRHDGDRPIGFAKSGNNHHAAFYRKPDGSVEQMVVKFWTAVRRKELGLPAVIRKPEEAWAYLENLPSGSKVEEIAAGLPGHDWTLIQTLQSDEMFVMGLSDEEWHDGLTGNQALLARNLYRVRIVSENFYNFRLHTFTLADVSTTNLKMGLALRCASVRAFLDQNPHKVKVTLSGKIIPIDD